MGIYSKQQWADFYRAECYAAGKMDAEEGLETGNVPTQPQIWGGVFPAAFQHLGRKEATRYWAEGAAEALAYAAGEVVA